MNSAHTLKLPMQLSARLRTSKLVLLERQSPMTRMSLRARLSSRRRPNVLRPSKHEMLLSASHRTWSKSVERNTRLDELYLFPALVCSTSSGVPSKDAKKGSKSQPCTLSHRCALSFFYNRYEFIPSSKSHLFMLLALFVSNPLPTQFPSMLSASSFCYTFIDPTTN